MNTNILKKCIDELKKESPKIDYVLGMMETLYEMHAPASTSTGGTGGTKLPPGVPTGTTGGSIGADEGSILDARARAAITEIKKTTDESMQ